MRGEVIISSDDLAISAASDDMDSPSSLSLLSLICVQYIKIIKIHTNKITYVYPEGKEPHATPPPTIPLHPAPNLPPPPLLRKINNFNTYHNLEI